MNVIFSTFFTFVFVSTVSSVSSQYKLHKESSSNNNRETLHRLVQLCGVRDKIASKKIFQRIVGGTFAAKNEFPWQVTVKYLSGGRMLHLCGGTVIGSSWVLTAAHCTKPFRIGNIRIIAGEHQLNKKDGTEQLRKIRNKIVHDMYESTTQINDISLLQLQTPLTLQEGVVEPACLPPPMQEYYGYCVISGWGKLAEKGKKNSNVLQKLTLPIIDDIACRLQLRKIRYYGPVTSAMMCAGYPQGLKDACQGDSGGPLVCPDSNNFPIISGIVSWGIGCARVGVPGVYTQVSHYIDWIEQKTGHLAFGPLRDINRNESVASDSATNSQLDDKISTQLNDEPESDPSLKANHSSSENHNDQISISDLTHSMMTSFINLPEYYDPLGQKRMFMWNAVKGSINQQIFSLEHSLQDSLEDSIEDNGGSEENYSFEED